MTPLRTDGRAPLYRRVLGEAWDSLPAPLQTMHDVQSERTADGVAVVERGSGLLARLVAFVIGLPPAGTDIPITVSFRARQGREYWQRNFAGHAFSSVQTQGRGRFVRLRLRAVRPAQCGHGIGMRGRTPAVRGPPLERVRNPAAAGAGAARRIAYEFVEAGRFRFHVEIAHPFTGLIVRYRGWLVLQA